MSNNWYLYGKTYDLTNFLDKHPGGKTILKITKNHSHDITATFEGYHAFADIENIRSQLETYKISDEGKELLYSFDDNGFYKTCLKKVRNYFGDELSITNKIKADHFWFMKIVFLLFIFSFLIKTYLYYRSNIIVAFIGILLIGLEFCTLHDASHFALFSRNSYLNETINRITNAIVFWNHEMWLKHHTFRHHTYTGDINLDPDLVHLRPFCRKTPLLDKNMYWQINNIILPYIIVFLIFFVPGLLVAQILSYWILWTRRGYLWKMDKIEYKQKWYEIVIMILVVLVNLWNANLIATLVYVTSLNISYAICIMPNHDTYLTVQNHISNETNLNDWGEIQVRNAANFQIHSYGDIFHHLFGGINYQIEHHLFPSMCHIHYPYISKIVKETCQEFNLPYTEYDTVYSAFLDFLKSICIINN